MYVCGTTRRGAVPPGGQRPLGNPKASGGALRPCPYVDELALEACPDVAQHRGLLQVPGEGRDCVTGCRGGTGRATRPQKCPRHPVGVLGHSLELGQVLQPVLLPRLLVAHDGQAAQRLHLHGATVWGHQGTAAPSATSHLGGFDHPKTPSCDLKLESPKAVSAGTPWCQIGSPWRERHRSMEKGAGNWGLSQELSPVSSWGQEVAALPSPQHPHLAPKAPTGAAGRQQR